MSVQVEGVVIPLASCMLVTAFFIVESRRLRASAYFYIAQSSLLVGVFLSIASLIPEPHFYLWAITAVITKVLIVPWLVLRTIAKLGVEVEEEPIIPMIPSFIADFSLMILGFWLGFSLPLPILRPGFRICFGTSLILMFLGIYGMTGKSCAIKQTICLCHLENGVHLLLATLAYATPITVEVGILTDAVLAIAIMLYLSTLIKKVSGSLSTYRLSSLRW